MDDARPANPGARLKSGTAARVLGAVSTSVLMVLFVDGLGVGRTWAYLASIPTVTVGLLVANRVWVFGEPR